MSVTFYLALLFGGSLAVGLALTFLHDLVWGLLAARRARPASKRASPTVLKPLALPKGEPSAPVLTVRLRPTAAAAEEEAPSFPNAA